MKKYLLLMCSLALGACNAPQETAQNPTQSNATAAAQPSPAADDTPLGRLPADVAPLHYTLQLEIIPQQATFSGHTRVRVALHTARKYMHLHGLNLTVHKASLHDQSGRELNLTYTQVDNSGVARLDFPHEISAGEYTLDIEYSAPFNEALEGLYRVKDGDEYYAFTQFEAISARLAFPGFDEPAFKVPFDISLIVPQAQQAVSNTPVTAEQALSGDQAGLKRVQFATTRPLPTYLLAFAVGPLDAVEWSDLPPTAVRPNSVPLRGFAARGKGHLLKYALENTQAILESLENEFGIPYPYAKLDLIAVPDFAAGAMENAGIITYREQLLLLDEHATRAQKRAYSTVHAHELAHHWFGNLVTPYWWDDIWLNEAFATWMAYATMHRVQPDARFDLNITARGIGAMKNDALISARQIRQPIATNHDISTAFDGITYSKGGAVLEMMNRFIGPDAFRRGIQAYLKRHAHGNANADDFIRAISENAGETSPQTIQTVFNGYLTQRGIPTVDVALSCEDGVNHVAVQQHRYRPLGGPQEAAQSWHVPLCLDYAIAGARHRSCRVLDNAQAEFTLPGSGCAERLLPNAGGSGYYRFNLDSAGWQSLYADFAALSHAEQMMTADSLLAAVQAGQSRFSDLLAVAHEMVNSDHSKVVIAAMEPVEFIADHLDLNAAQSAQLRQLADHMYRERLTELGEQPRADESSDDTFLRESLLEFLADYARNAPLRTRLKDMAVAFSGWGDDGQMHPQRADMNLIALALRVAVQDDGDGDFTQHLVTLLDHSDDGITRQYLLAALAATNDTAFAATLREWIPQERLRDNEIYTIIYAQMRHPQHAPAMWDWVQAHMPVLLARTPKWRHGRIARVGIFFCDAQQRAELNDFFAPRAAELSGGPRELAQTLESIDLCIARKAALADEVPALLDRLSQES